MKESLNILAISYGRHMFKATNAERVRQEGCAKRVSSLHMVIFTNGSDNFKTTIADNGLVLHPTNSRNKVFMLLDAIRIGGKILSQQKKSWVITAQDPFETSVVGLFLKYRHGHPLNIQEHADFFSAPYWKRDSTLNRFRFVLGKIMLCKADTVRVVSARIRNTMRSLGVQADRILYLPVRTDALNEEHEGESLRALYPEASVIVLSMARFVTQKNLPMLLTAFTEVAHHDPKALLVLVGQGPEEQKLRDQVAEADIQKQVVFLPWTDAPQSFMKSADVYALSSYWEGWARVLVEAMAAGTPTVTTDVGCANEVLRDGIHGFVTPVADTQAYTKQLVRLVQNKELRTEFGVNGRRDVASTHVTPEQYSRAWLDVLERTYEIAQTNQGKNT